jgi:prepilin-type N-terminal cleavage/methylation domain-containing protein
MSEQDFHDSGMTLVEVLLALLILGTAVIAFLAGVSSSMRASATHRQGAILQGVVRDEAEAIQLAVRGCPGAFVPNYTVPAGYSVTTSPLTCPTVGNPLQVTISAVANDGAANDSVVISVRLP